MSPFEIEYIGQTKGTELVTQTADRGGYRIVLSQEFIAHLNGGAYFWSVFDANNHLRAVSRRDNIYLPIKPHQDAPEIDGRVTPELATALLNLMIPKLREIDARENRGHKSNVR